MSGLVVTGIDVRAGERTILRDAGFTALAGTVTGLIGPNGAGKSTLITALLGLRKAASGTVRFDGVDLIALPPRDRARFCAYVEQFATTEERLTVRDVVTLGRVPFQSDWQVAPAEQDAAIVEAAIVGMGLTGFVSRLYHTLSGGEQQRVQLARALAQEPRLLVLDEPTSHLDIRAQLLVLEMLRRRAGDGCTVVLAMHDLNLAARYCDRLVVLQAGRVVAEGPPGDVLGPDLLLSVYGVHAEIVLAPGSSHPLVVYDRAELDDSASKSD
ncbi:MAG: ABC transporter ATP-binding protein [Hyphomicrobiales bacterium]|nr:MAG: ABC transporter ATP-binding protein [Hyphomicrobiales bacterium]